MNSRRPSPDDSRVVQVKLLPAQCEPGPFAPLPDWTPAIRALVFGQAKPITQQLKTTQTK